MSSKVVGCAMRTAKVLFLVCSLVAVRKTHPTIAFSPNLLSLFNKFNFIIIDIDNQIVAAGEFL
jgi:hypothetical protein